MTYRAHPSLLEGQRLRTLERELRRDDDLVRAFDSAAWTGPCRRRTSWLAVLVVGLALAALVTGLLLAPWNPGAARTSASSGSDLSAGTSTTLFLTFR